MVFLLIHHWVMPHSMCWRRPPGGLWGRCYVCLLVLGGGVSLVYRGLSASQPSTLGWLKDTDGPLPQSVSGFGELSKPAVCSQGQKPAFITWIQETPSTKMFCFSVLLLVMMKTRVISLFSTGIYFLCFSLCIEKKPCVTLIIYLSSFHHNWPRSLI